jgi:hypothetical protein
LSATYRTAAKIPNTHKAVEPTVIAALVPRGDMPARRRLRSTRERATHNAMPIAKLMHAKMRIMATVTVLR